MLDPTDIEPQPALQRVLRAMAVDAIGVEVGGRLRTSSQYQRELGVGAGTVQKALGVLVSSGALAVASRGHQGRQVVDRNVGRLWALSGARALRWLLPPLGPLECYGLAEAIADEQRRLQVPMELWYRRGAARRAEAVISGEADVTVMSWGAARSLQESMADGLDITDLGPDTYYAEGSILVLHRAGEELPTSPTRTRVGVDHSSYDHVTFTEAEFPPTEGYEYVECDFPHMPVAVAEGRVDVGIWHRMLLLIPLDLANVAHRPLQSPAARKAREELSRAVLVCEKSKPEVLAIPAAMDLSAVQHRQAELTGLDERSPELSELY
ncbi:hypothetical protein EF847_02840 [Actinobacteria bacterium YIM 96077]|uniref:GntR family transcriptional regulator n=1 Tax=Phytoactinopolyspora halophila TaxID=1981511 RepID=A0A329QEX6_9ACTN|nr:YhfZ family protein [Phytoactinopolyspora halophila]AYY11811.1 hypothetical protein EF847_02840 [Actinobacteria bacterium YIM 96077]RAW09832.1 hypothetical protein DPM12_20015 [Phytoactinopolyspora halophila]